jgi:hypothetical protein
VGEEVPSFLRAEEPAAAAAAAIAASVRSSGATPASQHATCDAVHAWTSDNASERVEARSRAAAVGAGNAGAEAREEEAPTAETAGATIGGPTADDDGAARGAVEFKGREEAAAGATFCAGGCCTGAACARAGFAGCGCCCCCCAGATVAVGVAAGTFASAMSTRAPLPFAVISYRV